MPAQPFWQGDSLEEQAWNFCWLGEDLLPGIVEVTCEKERDIDVQKTKGVDGPNLEDEGYPPAQVTITVRIFTREQWAAWQEVQARLDPEKPGGLRTPHAILHPEPNAKGVTHVYVKKISGSPPSSKSGKVERIDCLQWFPAKKPKKTSTTPKTKQKTPEPPQGLTDDQGNLIQNIFGGT